MECRKDAEGIPPNISSFLGGQTLISLATSADNIPYCANCFYSFDPTNSSIIFKSNRNSRHVRESLLNKKVAGTIMPASLKLGQIVGLQFQGTLTEPFADKLKVAQASYYKKYPFALVMPGDLWVIQLEYLKMTDNRMGFGKKIEWKIQIKN